MSDLTPAPTTLDEAVLAAEYSQAKVEFRGVTVTPSGYFHTKDDKGRTYRISLAKAEELAAEPAPAPEPAEPSPGRTEKRQPKRTGFAFESLNLATQALFFRLAEQIQEHTQDADQTCSVRLGHDIPKIELVDAPRLTSLKKAGLLETFEGVKKTHRHLRMTDAGRELWARTVGA
jgi:hypothetical protein